jgi:hypothetical protein
VQFWAINRGVCISFDRKQTKGIDTKEMVIILKTLYLFSFVFGLLNVFFVIVLV